MQQKRRGKGDVWTYTPPKHKGQWRGKPRTIKLGRQSQAVIKPFLTRVLADYLFSPRESMEERNAIKRASRKSKVQPSQRCRKKQSPKVSPRDRYDVASYRRAITYACRRLAIDKLVAKGKTLKEARKETKDGFPSFHPYQLRHSAITEVYEEHGPEGARAFAGHNTLSMTAHYTKRDEKLAERVAK